MALQTDHTIADSGAVYVFTKTNNVWQQEAYIKASNTDASDHFGSSISLSGDGKTLVVGAENEDGNSDAKSPILVLFMCFIRPHHRGLSKLI